MTDTHDDWLADTIAKVRAEVAAECAGMAPVTREDGRSGTEAPEHGSKVVYGQTVGSEDYAVGEIDCWFEREDGTRYWDDSPAWWFWSFQDRKWHWEGTQDGGARNRAICDEIGVTVWGTSADIEMKRDTILAVANVCGSPQKGHNHAEL